MQTSFNKQIAQAKKMHWGMYCGICNTCTQNGICSVCCPEGGVENSHLDINTIEPIIAQCENCIHYHYYGLSEETVSECELNHTENPDKKWFCADWRLKNE